MGLFTKRPDALLMGDDLSDSAIPVVQTVTPSAQIPGRAPNVRDVRVTPADPHGPPSQHIERRAPLEGASSPPAPPMPVAPRFGIEDALRLLRDLPGRDSAAVREAVQKTLEFMNVDLDRLVEDASQKDQQLDARANGLQREVEQHEALALAAKKQIQAIQAERTELEAARTWILEHRRQEPIPLERVVRGSPINPNER